MNGEHDISRRLALIVGLGAAACLAPTDAMARDAAGRVVTRWDAGCSGGARSWWDDMVRDWYDAISDAHPIFGHGTQAYGRDGLTVNANIVDSDFVDADAVWWGDDDDPGRPDAVDAFMVGLHGVEHSPTQRWMGRVRVDEPGGGNCNAYQGFMQFGDGDLEFLHLSSCFSMDREDWWADWSRSMDGVHQIDGFHGLMWIGDGLVDDYGDFADDAFWVGMASAWIDNMYQPEVSGSFDQCPVARNVGLTSGESSVRMSFERYNSVFPDPPRLGESRRHRVRYVKGCDPQAKGPL
jgi:hypothetical protein